MNVLFAGLVTEASIDTEALVVGQTLVGYEAAILPASGISFVFALALTGPKAEVLERQYSIGIRPPNSGAAFPVTVDGDNPWYTRELEDGAWLAQTAMNITLDFDQVGQHDVLVAVDGSPLASVPLLVTLMPAARA